jgi:DNA mismatch repair protein MutS2
MAPLEHTSARALESDSLRDILRAYASSPLGQDRIAALAASGDRGWIERQHRLTSEIRAYLRTGGRFDFSALLDPRKLVDQARIEGAALEPQAIRDILLVVDRADEWRHIAAHPPSDLREGFAAVTELSAAIEDFTDFLRFFRNKIQPDGTLDDRASPELAQIRREIEKQRRVIQESLRAYWPKAAPCRKS